MSLSNNPTNHPYPQYPYQNRSSEDMEGEEWKVISGFNDLFYVSNLGRVKSFARSVSGKIIAQRLYTKGEGLLAFKISVDGKEHEFRTAAIVYQTFIRELDFKLYNIAYKDGNSLNLRPSNLEAYKRYKQVVEEKKYHKQQLIAATASMYKYPCQNLSPVDMEGEIWKPFPELPDHYAVSNKGRVKSLERECRARDGGIRMNEAQILKQRVQTYVNTITKEEYQHLSVYTSVDYSKREFTISRLVYEAFVGPLDRDNAAKQIIRHKNNNHYDNTPDNLYLTNTAELQAELIKTGRRHRLAGSSDVSKFTHEEWEARYDTTRKPVSQFDLAGNFIKTFESRYKAAESIKVKQTSTISAAVEGRTKTAGGYQWRNGSDRTPMSPQYIKPHLRKAFKARKVAKYDLNGHLLEIYPSVVAAARINQIKTERLYRYIYSPQIVPRKGEKKFFWKYIDPDEEIHK